MSEKNNDDQGIKSISVTPFLTKILSPSADLLGSELRDYLKNRIDSVKGKKRDENVFGNILKARERAAKKNSQISIEQDSLKQLNLFEDWIDGVQDVDPDEKIISEMWQELLISIAKGEDKCRLHIDVLKKIDTNEAAMLLAIKEQESIFSSTQENEHSYYLKRLAKLGLVETSNIKLIKTSAVFFLVLMFILSITLFFENFSYLLPIIISLVILYGIFIAYMRSQGWGVLSKFGWPSVYILSWLGKDLTNYIKVK